MCPKTRAFLEICHFFFTPRTFVVKPGEKKPARLVANKKSNDRRIKAGLDITKGRLRHLKVHSLLLLLLLLLLMLLLSVVCSRRVGGDIPTAHSSTPQLVLRPSVAQKAKKKKNKWKIIIEIPFRIVPIHRKRKQKGRITRWATLLCARDDR